MKKFLEVLVIVIVVLGIGFGFLAVNPQWGLSQKILPMFMANKPAVVETGVLQTTGIDLTNCVSYFDGCNNCSVKDGKADACTLMYCETPSEAKCLEYVRTGSEVTGVEKEGIYTIEQRGLIFHYATPLESMSLPGRMEYDGAEGKVRERPLYIGGIHGQKMIAFTEKPYHISDGIDDYTLTLEQKKNFLEKGECPWEDVACIGKKVGKYDILYMYGLGSYDNWFIAVHIFILSDKSFIYVEDTHLLSLIEKVSKEDDEKLQKKATQLGLKDEQLLYSKELQDYQKSLLQEKIKNPSGAMLAALQYAQTVVDGIQLP